MWPAATEQGPYRRDEDADKGVSRTSKVAESLEASPAIEGFRRNNPMHV